MLLHVMGCCGGSMGKIMGEEGIANTTGSDFNHEICMILGASLASGTLGFLLLLYLHHIQEQVAMEYGAGLAQLANEENVVDAVSRDLQVFADVFAADPKVFFSVDDVKKGSFER